MVAPDAALINRMNANSYDSPSSAGGNTVEWIDGVLTILEPEQTPFASMVRKDSDAKATFHQVGADTLRPARTAGTREGSSGSGSSNKAVKRAMFGAYLHRWLDTYGVTDVQQAVSKAGGNHFVDDEYANAKAKALREMKRDMEATFLSDIETQGGTDDEMKLRGAFTWLASTQTPAIPSDFINPAAQRLTGVADLKEYGANSINSVLKSLATKGGSGEYHLFGGVDYIEDIDAFTRTGDGGTTVNRYRVEENGQARTITMMVKVFQTSHGRVVVHPDNFLRIDSSGVGDTDSCLILDMDHWKVSFLERLHSKDDPEDAAGMTGFVKAIGGLFCKMPKGSAYIYNS